MSNASAADQHCAKRWHTTGAALAKHRRGTAFQCWQTTNILHIRLCARIGVMVSKISLIEKIFIEVKQSLLLELVKLSIDWFHDCTKVCCGFIRIFLLNSLNYVHFIVKSIKSFDKTNKIIF